MSLFDSCARSPTLVTSVEVFLGNTNEGVKLKGLLEGEKGRGLKPGTVAADKLYDLAENREYLREERVKGYMPFYLSVDRQESPDLG